MTKPFVQAQSTSWRLKYYLMNKRLFDIVFASFALLCCLPVFIVLAFMLKMSAMQGTVLFRQQRLGLHGKMFTIYKFRTMVPDAEQRLVRDAVLYEKYIANDYKLAPEEDPRMTAFGRFLRKTSLDELPQLWNILKGDMSFVGPRPIIEAELVHYGTEGHAFLSVKPGLTGYWQVNGRSDIHYPQRAELELFYAYHASIMLDVKILLKTVWVVMLRKGAY